MPRHHKFPFTKPLGRANLQWLIYYYRKIEYFLISNIINIISKMYVLIMLYNMQYKLSVHYKKIKTKLLKMII